MKDLIQRLVDAFKSFDKKIMDWLQSNYSNKKLSKFINNLTYFRFGASFAIPIIFAVFGGIAACGSLAIIGITDFLDGHLARGLDLCSDDGAKWDQRADKAMNIGSGLALLLVSPIAAITVAMEAVIAFINLAKKKMGLETDSSLIGKGKTALLIIALVSSFLVADLNIENVSMIINSILGGAAVIQGIAGVDYLKDIIVAKRKEKADDSETLTDYEKILLAENEKKKEQREVMRQEMINIHYPTYPPYAPSKGMVLDLTKEDQQQKAE